MRGETLQFSLQRSTHTGDPTMLSSFFKTIVIIIKR
ncbi:MAG: hypothetical protein RL260_3448 [Pseudomonadota bacterium]|jgi:hypothetical protein